jgi:hypothetical protein
VLLLPPSVIALAYTAPRRGVGSVTCLHLGFGVFDFSDFKGIGWGAIDTIVYLIAHLQRNIPCGVYQRY